ncbi:MAG: DUF362 domain-containing protein [Bryobacteraceae bacterium]
MRTRISRRNLLFAAAAGAQAAAAGPPRILPIIPHRGPLESDDGHTVVAVIPGQDRYSNITAALQEIESQIHAGLLGKRSILIKPNIVDPSYPLAITHPDALRAILDFFVPRFNGPIVIGESSAMDTFTGYDTLGYPALIQDYAPHPIQLLDFNAEGLYSLMYTIDFDSHIAPTRLAARLFDPTAYIISIAMLKTHNVVVATMSVKNMLMGAPLHQPPGATTSWSDKRNFHIGVRGQNYDLFANAQLQRPFWSLGIIDGLVGMEGDGPTTGTPVNSQIALASTDLIALDRVGLEAMGIDPTTVGYLTYCGQAGLGQYDLTQIDMRPYSIEPYQIVYQLHDDIAQELEWMGPAADCGDDPVLG